VSLTLLLDLDDTLLENDIDEFLPHYLEAFAEEISSFISPDKFIKTLMMGTRKMQENQRPDCTLKEVFDSEFFPVAGLDSSRFRPMADRFYREIFPKLQKFTHPRPEAKALVEQAFARGYRVAIATNPLFPRAAVLHRLAWADLPAEKYPFEVISDYETFHFAKPEVTYYAEVLAHMGWPSGPAVMVGDDIRRDLTPARNLGLPAFWITREKGIPESVSEAPTASGWLSDVLGWLDSVSEESLQADFSSPVAMMAILRSTPAALDSFCRYLPAQLWTKRPKQNEWSPTEIICHLRDVDLEVNQPRLEQVIQQTNPFLPGKDTDPWAEERKYIQQDGRFAMQEFITGRMKMIKLLEALHNDDWNRPARHAIFGPTQLAELVSIIAGHDRLHIQQIHQVLEEIL